MPEIHGQEPKKISYLLTYKTVKNINIRVKADGSVAVSANKDVSEASVDKFVQSRYRFITRAVRHFQELQRYEPQPKKFVSGESFYYLGRELRLKVLRQKQEQVYTDGVYLFLQVRDDNLVRKEKLVKKWFKKQSRTIFAEYNLKLYARFQKYGLPLPKIAIKNMNSRWGSSQPRHNTISLNAKLIEVPPHCIEYVLMHEYCHFIHPDHSHKFYDFLTMMMPDWTERKKLLESPEFYILLPVEKSKIL